MAAHIQIVFSSLQPEQQEWIIAHLAEAGFDGFEEKEGELIAYVPEKEFDREFLKELAFKYQLSYQTNKIPAQNWNALWESNFPPVIIDDFAGIRADFHEPLRNVQHEIIITPKMSFGTGHHATTGMMIRQLSQLNLANKSVFDFGTGTGILAILAEKLGASRVVAADNDDWSIENARENILKNHCSKIELIQTDTVELSESFDVILANINRNVIVEHFAALVGLLKRPGSLVISGFLADDESEMRSVAGSFPLSVVNVTAAGQWLSMRFDTK